MKRKIVFSVLGTTLDSMSGPDRWSKWRPNVAMCQHDDLLIDQLELLYDKRHLALAKRVAKDIHQVSPETDVNLVELNLSDPWDLEQVYAGLHAMARGYTFDPDNENYLIQITTGTHVVQICWFLLTEARYLPGRLLQIAPPKRWREGKPGDYTIIDLDMSRYDQIATRFAEEREEAASFLKSGIKTRNPDFNAMIDRIETVALRSDAPILLAGPTGAGKTQLARRIYDLKQGRHLIEGEFVEINCATLRGDQAMSALFGHVKGAFTGAATDRPGLLKAADKGMLFLDEIGELGLDEQAMMLRAIEEGRFLPVGADREEASRFLVIAGTNRNLNQAVAEGRFREDLLARLDLWRFRLPGLSERLQDLVPNLEFELARFATQSGRRVTFNREAEDLYSQFATGSQAIWPGNFRDLGGSVTRMATFAASGRITRAIVEEEISNLLERWGSPDETPDAEILQRYFSVEKIAEVDLFDRAQLAQVLTVCKTSNSLSDAGRKLFAVSRLGRSSVNDSDRLRKYLQRFDLSWANIQSSG